MDKTIQVISTDPSALVSLLSAIIAAAIALVIFSLTQFLTRKNEQSQFLAPKLEELYLLLNKVGEENANFAKLLYLSIEGDINARNKIISTDEIDLYGHRMAKQIIMYIRLYFPKLSKIHQHLFAAQRDLNELLYSIHVGEPPDLKEAVFFSGKVAHFIRLMEAEIINNRDYLLADHVFPKRFKETSQSNINAVNLPPNADPFG